jgi:hypothetical protein
MPRAFSMDASTMAQYYSAGATFSRQYDDQQPIAKRQRVTYEASRRASRLANTFHEQNVCDDPGIPSGWNQGPAQADAAHGTEQADIAHFCRDSSTIREKSQLVHCTSPIAMASYPSQTYAEQALTTPTSTKPAFNTKPSLYQHENLELQTLQTEYVPSSVLYSTGSVTIEQVCFGMVSWQHESVLVI